MPLRVVLHRARPERIEVACRSTCSACDRLVKCRIRSISPTSGNGGGAVGEVFARDELDDRLGRRHIARRQPMAPPAGLGEFEDRSVDWVLFITVPGMIWI